MTDNNGHGMPDNTPDNVPGDDELKKFIEETLGESLSKGEQEYKEEQQQMKNKLDQQIDNLTKNMPPEAQVMFRALFSAVNETVQKSEELDQGSSRIFNREALLGVAHQAIPAEANEPVVAEVYEAFKESCGKATLWIDAVTDFEPADGKLKVLRPVDWLDESVEGWETFIAPIASGTSNSAKNAMHSQLENMKEMMGLDEGMEPELESTFKFGGEGFMAQIPLHGDANSMEGMMDRVNRASLSIQSGHALGFLANHALTGTYYGLPLFGDSPSFILHNIKSYVQEYAKSEPPIPADEMVQFLAVRESAGVRLFSCVPWLKGHILSTISNYASRIDFNINSIQETLSEVNPENIDELKKVIQEMESPKMTPEQQKYLNDIKTVLALLQGWICCVAFRAASPHLQHFGSIRETTMRELVSKDPLALAFGRIMGISLGSIKYQKAISFWEQVYAKLGAKKADEIWKHPDNLPNELAFDNVDGFLSGNKEFLAVNVHTEEVEIEHNWDDLLNM